MDNKVVNKSKAVQKFRGQRSQVGRAVRIIFFKLHVLCAEASRILIHYTYLDGPNFFFELLTNTNTDMLFYLNAKTVFVRRLHELSRPSVIHSADKYQE